MLLGTALGVCVARHTLAIYTSQSKVHDALISGAPMLSLCRNTTLNNRNHFHRSRYFRAG